MSAPLPTFSRRRVRTGEVALPVAIAGDSRPLPCGHVLHEERPDEVVDPLQGFLPAPCVGAGWTV
jgi:hypothetical protein